jgi:hypothetical protein
MEMPFCQDLWCTHYAWPSSTGDRATVQQSVYTLLCLFESDGNAVARSILLVPKIIRKKGPLKIKINATSFSYIF